MSAFPTNPADEIDAIVKAKRATTPQAVLDQRAVPRASVKELNATDLGTLRERFLSSRRDDRGPITKFLDLIDAGRQTIINTIAPSLAEKARARGDTGAFGMGKVYGSDVLDSVGIHNHLARGVLGFGLDVALDPLTYLGPAGWGLKASNAAGQGVRIGLRGRRAIEGGIKAVRQGGLGAIRDPHALELFTAAAKSAPSGLDNAGLAAHLSESVLGKATGGRVGKAISRVGGETHHEGGILANFAEFGQEGLQGEQAAAARNFVQQYGKAAAPGLRIGKDTGSTVAHIPFTEIGIHVPAFTQDARAGVDAARIAGAVGRVKPEAAVPGRVLEARRIAGEIEAAERGTAANPNTALAVAAKQRSADIEAQVKALSPQLVREIDPVKREALSNQIRDLRFTQEQADAEWRRAVAGRHPWELTREEAPSGEWKAAVAVQDAGGVWHRGLSHEHHGDIFRRLYAAERDPANVEDLDRIGWKLGGVAVSLRDLDATNGDLHKAFVTKALAEGKSVPAAVLREYPEFKGRIAEQIDGLRQSLEQTVRGSPIPPASPENVGELLSLKRLLEQGQAAADSAKASGLEQAADAHARYASAVRGSVLQLSKDADEPTRRIVKRLIGIDDDVMGSSLLAPFRTAAKVGRDEGVAADIYRRIDGGIKRTFGQPGGMLRNVGRYLRNTLTVGGRDIFKATEHGIRSDILRAMDEAGLKVRTADDYQKAAQVVLAQMHLARGDAAFFPTKFNSTEPAEWVSLLQQAKNDGFFSGGPTKGLLEKLNQIATQNVHVLDTLGESEHADEILQAVLPGYLPTGVLPGAQARIRSIDKFRLKEKPGGSARNVTGMAKEGFQKPKSTYQYRWESPEGGQKRFWEKDRWAQTVTPAEMEAIRLEDPQAAKHVENLQQTIAEYDTLAKDNPEWAAANPKRQTDPWELNQMVQDGHFSLLLGGDEIPGGFADTSAATVMAARMMAHERAVARQTWLDYVSQFGVTVDPQMQGRKVGNQIILKDGSEAKFFRDRRSGEWGVEVLGERYRPLSKGVQGLKDNPIIQGIGRSTANLYHEDVARQIEDVASLYDDDPAGVLRLMDAVTGAWKTQVLMHPSWTIANLAGDMVNALTGGMRAADAMKHAKDAAAMVMHADDPERLAQMSLNIRGVPMTGEQLINDVRAHRLWGTNQFAETAMQLVNRKFFVPQSTVRGAEGRSAGHVLTNLKDDFLQRLSHEAAANKTVGGAKAAGFVARDRMLRWVLGPWFRANEKVNNYTRLLAYMSYLEQGHDIPSAVQRTLRSQLDYADLSRVERSYFRRMWPFYSYMRLNGAYQMKLLMERPIYAGSFPLLQNAVEEAISGDQQVPLHARPNWMRNQLALMVGSDPDERFALMLGQALPMEQGLAVGQAATGVEGMQDLLRYFITNSNPVIRVPAEVGVGREFFGNRTIGRGGDVGALEYLGQQVRPVREVGKVAETVSKQGVGPAVARGLLGGRVQAADDERLRYARLAEFKDEEERLRKRFRKDQREGRDTLGARAKLMQLYQAMDQAGLGDETPKWAQKQLPALAPTAR